jgi:hypothetical protein
MITTPSYTTLASYKANFGIPDSNTEEDGKLSLFITGINKMIANILNIPESEYDDVYIMDEGKLQIFNSSITVNSIENFYYIDSTNTITAIPSIDISIFNGRAIITDPTYIENPKKVIYSPYYDLVNDQPVTTSIPADLTLAANMLVRHYVEEQFKSSMGVASQSVSFVPSINNIPKHIMGILNMYREL